MSSHMLLSVLFVLFVSMQEMSNAIPILSYKGRPQGPKPVMYNKQNSDVDNDNADNAADQGQAIFDIMKVLSLLDKLGATKGDNTQGEANQQQSDDELLQILDDVKELEQNKRPAKTQAASKHQAYKNKNKSDESDEDHLQLDNEQSSGDDRDVNAEDEYDDANNAYGDAVVPKPQVYKKLQQSKKKIDLSEDPNEY